MKTINVKPVPTICIKLENKKYLCTFNMLAMAYVQECFGQVGDIKLSDISPARMASIILYSGIKANDEDFTMDEAVALTMKMGAGNYGEIIEEFNTAYLDSLSGKNKEQVKKKMAQILASALPSTSA